MSSSENMAEEESKPLNFIPEVILKKRKSNEAWALRKKAQLERSNFQSNKNKDATIKKPEDFVIQYRNMELDLIRMKRRVKRKLPQLNSDSKPLIVIRIHGKNDMHPKTRKNLYSLGLRRVFNAVFLKPSDGVLAKLQRVEPFVTYGYPNLKSIKELIYKKGHMKIEKRKVPLTDNNIVEQELGKYGIVCIEDMVHQIYNVGPHFKEVIQLMWPFELNKPVGGLTGSKTLFKDGGDSGNRDDVINELVSKMN
ncbi:large ribosomal subunit protein uL30z isoform X1 [Arachis hypogaea]|nr:60S ribosomal protein L7-1 isoform X1 [Arachis hypogaea]QHO28773.1 60S ribosomal protein [Arachis hypogaea]